jgi:hypothetical protein
VRKRCISKIGVLTLSMLACRSEPEFPNPCAEPITVQVRVGSEGQPSFRWSPECGISALVVNTVPAPGAQETTVWSFRVPEQSPLRPDVTYGNAPGRATVWTGPQQLVPGTRYRVHVRMTVGEDVMIASGETTFTAWYPPD